MTSGNKNAVFIKEKIFDQFVLPEMSYWCGFWSFNAKMLQKMYGTLYGRLNEEIQKAEHVGGRYDKGDGYNVKREYIELEMVGSRSWKCEQNK